MVEASAAVERRKASASRWTRGRARSAFGWQHPMRGEAPRDSCAFSALRLPLSFGGKRFVALVGKTRAPYTARTRALASPSPAGGGSRTAGARGGVHGGAGSRSALARAFTPSRRASRGDLPPPGEGGLHRRAGRGASFSLRKILFAGSKKKRASENVWTAPRLLCRVEVCAPSTTLLRRVVPLPRCRGGGKTITSSTSAWRCRSGSSLCLRR
jgi:hypothetical protein